MSANGPKADKRRVLIGRSKRLAGPDQEGSAYQVYRTVPVPA
jgi:hypothetical protein